LEGAGLQEFLDAASGAVNATAPAVMLTPGIHRNYEQSFDRMAGEQAVSQLARGADSGGPHCGRAALFSVSARSLLADSRLAEEMFGPASLVVRCADRGELLAVLEHLEGQLTMTLQMDEPDHSIAQALLPTLERKAGRLIVHGGPFPATSDGRSTSVGTLAIERFLRPVCYQGFPESLLPEPLGDAQIRQWPHRLDGNHRAGVPDSVSPKR